MVKQTGQGRLILHQFTKPQLSFTMDDADNENYPSHSRVDNVFSAASAMHVTVVRSHTLGISVGRSNSIEPQLNQFNDQAFEPIDYAIKTAAAHNIHLIIPLVDNYYY